jgi:hypothetical protein
MLGVSQGENQDLISVYKNYPLIKFPREKLKGVEPGHLV